MRIAVLEDEPNQMERLVHVLEHQPSISDESVSCIPFYRSESLRRALRRDTFDLLVLDWDVPDFNGLELLSWLRQQRESSVPVLIVGAHVCERVVSEALLMGADDFVAKPPRPLELAARTWRLLRRQLPAAMTALERFGAWVFDRISFTVHVEATSAAPADRVALSESEFRLALALFRNMGRSVSRAHLVECIGYSGEAPTRALDSQIYRLRIKLALHAHGLSLRTVYGLGYRLEVSHQVVPEAAEACLVSPMVG